jgi:hypothetical protein
MKQLVHLEKFLNKYGFKSTSNSDISVAIDFIDNSKTIKSEEEFIRIRKEAENTLDVEIQDQMYEQSWEMYLNTEQEFLPKLSPIAIALNKFYENRRATYRSLLFLNFKTFEFISISANEDLYNFLKNDPSLLIEIEKEFEDFDSFLKDY